MPNYRYEISLYSPFIENKQLLEELYLPIIGKDSLAVYDKLRYFHDYINNTLFPYNKNHNELLKRLGFDWDEFEKNRKKLESVDLLETYLNEDDEIYSYVLKEPLNYDEFISDSKMYSLLKNRTTEEQFTKINYYFSKFTQTSKMMNVSESVDYLITETEQRDIFLYNFEKLITNLASDYHCNFSFGFETKKLIDDFYNQERLSFNTIYEMVCQSICKDNKQNFFIDAKVLETQINNYKENKRQETILKTKHVNRNSAIFNISRDINEFKDVINEYDVQKSENYIVMATKQCINKDIQDTLYELRNNYNFSDGIINAIIDYTCIKNNGALYKKYILSIANSILSQTCKTTIDAVEYLRKTKMKKVNNIGSFTKRNQKLELNEQQTISQIDNKLNNSCDLSDYDEEQLSIINSFE